MQAFLAKLVALFLSFLQSFVHVMCITNYSYLQNLVWYIFRLQLPQKVYSLQSKPRCCPKVTFPNFAKIFTSPVWEILIPKPISYLIHLGLNSYIILRHFCPFYFVLGLNTILSNIEQTWTSFSNTIFLASKDRTSNFEHCSTHHYYCPEIEHETLHVYVLHFVWMFTSNSLMGKFYYFASSASMPFCDMVKWSTLLCSWYLTKWEQ